MENEDHNEIVLEETLVIDNLDYWEKMLEREDIVYDDEKWGQYQTVAKWTAHFKDGFEIDLKVNTNRREDMDLFSEAVLFDENGIEMACSDAEYDLKGKWSLSWYEGGDKKTIHTYTINVVGK